MEGGFWVDLLRNIFGWLDSIIYGFIDDVYNTFTNLANYTILSQGMLDSFRSRIYILIGVFMLFKMAFSLLNYFVDPDKIKDSKSGFGNLVQRIVISLVLLVLVPWIFNIAFYAQSIILNENILANIILGTTYVEKDGNNNVVKKVTGKDFVDVYNDAGKMVATSVLGAFLYPVDTEVINMTDKEIENKYSSDSHAVESLKTYNSALKEHNINDMVGWGDDGIKNHEDKDGYYLYSYSAGLSTIAGVVVIWILLVFCIDVGVRSVKLAFLQLIAPIPVLSYIDVSKGKDIFDRWVKECVSTYLGVFVRLLAIYFVIYVITLISQNGFSVYTYVLTQKGVETVEVQNVGMFAKALIIIGLLYFAVEIPKLIETLFGIKTGNFTLNPMKKLGAVPLLGGAFVASASAGRNAIGAGKDALKAKLKGESAKEAVSKRFRYAKDEFKGKLREGGLKGSENYSTKSAASQIRAEKDKLNETAGEARVTKARNKFLWEKGNKLKQVTTTIGGLKDAAKAKNYAKYRGGKNHEQATANALKDALKKEYEKIYKNKEFIQSLTESDVASELYNYKTQILKEQEASYNSIVQQHNGDLTNAEVQKAAEALQQAREGLESQSKILDARKKEHEINQKIYTSDAEIETAIKVAKGPEPL